jgi:prepilin-type N-terminal cleavage/methylation domain-containing protein
MVTNNIKNNRGFTLIELLVVISIIALLSVVVMSSVGEARQKAQNKARNAQLIEYEKALELYKSDNPNEGYPSNRASNPNNYICLGMDNCQGFVSSDDGVNNPDLDEKLQDYIQPWVDSSTVDYSGYNMSGLAYKCIDNPVVNGKCEDYSIQWYLTGHDQDCIRGSVPVNLPSADITRCLLES